MNIQIENFGTKVFSRLILLLNQQIKPPTQTKTKIKSPKSISRVKHCNIYLKFIIFIYIKSSYAACVALPTAQQVHNANYYDNHSEQPRFRRPRTKLDELAGNGGKLCVSYILLLNRIKVNNIIYIQLLQSAALSSATQHAMPSELGGKWGTECLNARFPLPSLLWGVKLISLIFLTPCLN